MSYRNGDKSREHRLRKAREKKREVIRGLKVKADGQRRNLIDLLAYPEISFDQLAEIWPDLAAWPAQVFTPSVEWPSNGPV